MKYFPYLLGIPLQLIGLSGLVDNIIVWQGFFQEILNIYSAAKDIIFGWLPFNIPSWCMDYLVIGIGLSSAHIRASILSTADYTRSFHEQEISIREILSISLVFGVILAFVCNILLWPFVIFTNIIMIFWRPPHLKGLAIVSHFWISLLLVIAIFFGFLFVFSDITEKL